MPVKNNTIRCITLALIEKENKYLVFKAKDSKNGKEFYRSLGGGIEFGETSEQALKREIKEEIGAEIINLKLIKVIENIFEYEGLDMHEVVFFYTANFKDKEYYGKEGIPIIDSKLGRVTAWVEADSLKQANFYPDGVKALI